MNEQHKLRLELFAANTQEIKKDFKWQNIMVNRLAALLYAVEDKVVDGDAIRESHELIKKSTGLFSAFRGNSAISIAALLSLSSEKDKRLSDTLAVYDLMKEAKFRASDYLVVAAYQIAANTTSDKYLQTVERAKAFYDGMKEKHRFLTGQDDYIFAAMLGLSDIDIERGVERMEELYAALKPEFLSGNSVQALTQVLILGEEAAPAAARVLALRDAFRLQNIRLDKEYTLSSLGVLSLLPYDKDIIIVNDVSEAYELLRTKKGFGSWSITKQELLLLAAALVAFKYVDDVRNGILTATLSTSITNIIIAQQTAIAVAAASSAAAASSSSD